MNNSNNVLKPMVSEINMSTRFPFLLSIAWVALGVGSLAAHENVQKLRHWEIPSKDPDRIILTFNGDPATSRAVTWRTDATIDKAVAQIAEATVNSKFEEQSVSKDAITEPFDLGMYKSNASLMVHYHSVTLINLSRIQCMSTELAMGMPLVRVDPISNGTC